MTPEIYLDGLLNKISQLEGIDPRPVDDLRHLYKIRDMFLVQNPSRGIE